MPSPCRTEPPWRAATPVVVLLVAIGLVAAGVVLSAPPAAAGAAQGVGEPLDESPRPEPDEVRAEAERILTDDRFEQEPAEDPTTGPGGGGGGGGEPADARPSTPEIPQPPPFAGLGTVGTVIMWIVVVAVVALAVWVIVRALANRRRRRDEDDDAVEDEPVAVVDDDDDLDPLLRPADDWRRLAAAQEAEGRWREGMRSRYRGLLADLIERRTIADVAGWTTGELRLEVAAASPAVAEDFSAASELFDRAWYGARPTGAGQRDRFVELEASVLASAVAATTAGTDITDLVGAAPTGVDR